MRTPLLLLLVSLSLFTAADAMGAMGDRDRLKLPMTLIPEGKFVMGSGPVEREYGYSLDENNKSYASRKYKWFESEERKTVDLKSFYIDANLVTNEAYEKFVKATGHPAPYVDQKTWKGYRLVHNYGEVQRFLWKGGTYPKGRGDHPVVLVSHRDAEAFCNYRGLHLPTEAQWEKAARGTQGRYFPWGNVFIPENLNSYLKGPFDTMPVGSYPKGKSVYGIFDMAGQVFEWTMTPHKAQGKFVVKGGSWDDYPGVTRSAARHGRPEDIKHILIGFRCAGDKKP